MPGTGREARVVESVGVEGTAPRVFITYTHDSPEHSQRVLGLANRLRADGIDCRIDQYARVPPANWPRWMIQQLQEADVVLVVCTETYCRRMLGEVDEEEGQGLGARWESIIVLQQLYEGARPDRFVPVIFAPEDRQNIPIVLRGSHHYLLDADYAGLYQRLLGEIPAMPPLGKLKAPQGARRIFGIDLGTTQSCIACCNEDGDPLVLPNAEGEMITPSAVYFESPERILVGREALHAGLRNPDRLVSLIKREMGNPTYRFEAFGRSYSPEEISSFILRKLVEDAERTLGEEIRDVVITCPAYFGSNERAATVNAGVLAGLSVKQVLNEPTAAAICYGLSTRQEQAVLVYDLGGGTFDVTVMSVRQGKIEVICTGGDFRLGGRDWDDEVTQHLAEEFLRQHPDCEDPRDDFQGAEMLVHQAEEVKKAVSSEPDVRAQLMFHGRIAAVVVTREQVEQLCAPLLERTLEMTRTVLQEAQQRGVPRIRQVLLVGGSSRMPSVARRLKEMLGVEPLLFEPDLAVARGAALMARNLLVREAVRRELSRQSGQELDEVQVGDATPAALDEASEAVAADFEVPGPAILQMACAQVVNVAAKGFGIMARSRKDEDQVVTIIHRNTPLPCEQRRTFGTYEDCQVEVVIRVMEQAGEVESKAVSQNRELGQGVIEGIPPTLPAGSPIYVWFRLAEDGMLQVRAEEPSSRQELTMRFEVEGVLSHEEVETRKQDLMTVAVG